MEQRYAPPDTAPNMIMRDTAASYPDFGGMWKWINQKPLRSPTLSILCRFHMSDWLSIPNTTKKVRYIIEEPIDMMTKQNEVFIQMSDEDTMRYHMTVDASGMNRTQLSREQCEALYKNLIEDAEGTCYDVYDVLLKP